MPLPHMAHLKYHFYVGVHVHDGYLMPEQIPGKLPHIALDTLQGVLLGEKPSFDLLGTLGGNPKIDPTLGPLWIPFEGRGNDSGLLVPHFSIPMNNVLLPLTIAFGSSIALLGSSGVQVATHNPLADLDELPWPLSLLAVLGDSGETDVAANILPLYPFSANLACFDPIPLPLDMVFAPNNVLVGITLRDVAAAVFSLVIEVAFAVIGNKLGDLVGSAPGKLKKVMNWMAFGDSFGKVGKEVAEEAAETTSEAAAKGASKAGGEAAESVGGGTNRAGGELAEEAAGATRYPKTRHPRADVRVTGARTKRGRAVPQRPIRDVAPLSPHGRPGYRIIARKCAESITGGVVGSFGSTFDEGAGWLSRKVLKQRLGVDGITQDDALSDQVGLGVEAAKRLGVRKLGLGGDPEEEQPDHLGDVAAALVPDKDDGHPRPTLTAPEAAEVDGRLRANAPFRVEVHFDHAVQEFTSDDVVATNAQVGGFAPAGGGENDSFSFTLTPTSNGKVSASVATATCFRQLPWRPDDLFSSDPFRGPRYPNLPGRIDVWYSSERPTVTLEATDGGNGATSAARVRLVARFSEDVHFEAGKIEARAVDTGEPAEILDFESVDGSGREYTFSVDVEGYEGKLSVRIPENGAETPFGNGSHASAVFHTRVDRAGPTAQVAGPGAATGTSPVPFHVSFDEPVRFAPSHAVARCAGQPAAITRFERTGESSYVVDVEAEQSGVVELTIPAGAVEDLAGNANEDAAEDSVDYDPVNTTNPDSADLAHLPPQDREAIGIGAEIMGLRSAQGTA